MIPAGPQRAAHIRDDAVKAGALVTLALLLEAELLEVLGGFGDGIHPQLHAAGRRNGVVSGRKRRGAVEGAGRGSAGRGPTGPTRSTASQTGIVSCGDRGRKMGSVAAGNHGGRPDGRARAAQALWSRARARVVDERPAATCLHDDAPDGLVAGCDVEEYLGIAAQRERLVHGTAWTVDLVLHKLVQRLLGRVLVLRRAPRIPVTLLLARPLCNRLLVLGPPQREHLWAVLVREQRGIGWRHSFQSALNTIHVDVTPPARWPFRMHASSRFFSTCSRSQLLHKEKNHKCCPQCCCPQDAAPSA